MSETTAENPFGPASGPLTNPFSGPAAEWLENVRKRIGVERQRESRYENKLLNLRPSMLKNVKGASDDYDATLTTVAQAREKLRLLAGEERDALAEVETERQAADAAAKEQRWTDAGKLADILKAAAARYEAAIVSAGQDMDEIRALVGQMQSTVPGKTWIKAADLLARIEGAAAVALGKSIGGQARGMAGYMSEAALLKASFGAQVGDALAAYLYRADKPAAGA